MGMFNQWRMNPKMFRVQTASGFRVLIVRSICMQTPYTRKKKQVAQR
jgi:hypothetical protein